MLQDQGTPSLKDITNLISAKISQHLLPILILFSINFIVYRDYWLTRKIFSGKDFLTLFYPLLNFQSDCLQQGSWPLWNPFLNFGYPYVDHYVNSAMFPTHLIMGLTSGTTVESVQWEILTWIIIGGFGIYLCVLNFGLSKLTGILAASSFMACGQIMALPQWSTLVYNASCFPFLIYGYHRAKNTCNQLSLVSIAFLALSILGGYMVSTVLGLYFFGCYVLLDALITHRLLFAVRYLAITVLAAVLLTLPKLVPLYLGMSAGPRMGKGASLSLGAPLDTFNIISPYNFFSLLLPVKFYFSIFIGTVIILALIRAIITRSMKVTPILIITFLSAWLLLSSNSGHESLLRTGASYLPFMKLVRNDWLNWYYPSIFAILWAAPHIETYLSDHSFKNRLLTLLLFSGALSTVFFLSYSTGLYRSAYVAHLALAAGWTMIICINKYQPIYLAAVIALITTEFIMVFTRTTIDVAPRMENGKVLYTVVDQGSVSRSLLDDNKIHSGFGAVAVQDHLRPVIDDARQHPYLTSGLDGDPGYNLYPGQYGKFIDSMNLKRFSGWWYNSQERYDFIQLKNSPKLAAMEGLPLFLLLSEANLTTTGSASFDAISCSSFDFTVSSPESSYFLLHQFYDSRWKATVDGKELPIQRANDYFMSVELNGGTHKIRYEFSDRYFNCGVIISSFTLCGLLTLSLRRSKSISINS